MNEVHSNELSTEGQCCLLFFLLKVTAEVDKAKFDSEQGVQALDFDVTNMSKYIQRQFMFIKNIGPSAEPNQNKVQRVSSIRN